MIRLVWSSAKHALRAPQLERSFLFEAESPRLSALLIHGMSDSPYSVRSLAERLHASGASVVGLRVPGHGTAPSGLLRLDEIVDTLAPPQPSTPPPTLHATAGTTTKAPLARSLEATAIYEWVMLLYPATSRGNNAPFFVREILW
jgi:hypothetical protein